MCGFVAMAGSRATRDGVIESGLRTLLHRGPDGTGFWRAADGRAALGHARLAIIDLSAAGAQPMVSSDGQGVLVYNGEIYNHRELRARVDIALRSSSDTEVLLELVRARGAEALAQLRGMFAFAYWDGEQLLLVRDRLGIKPLYYAERGGEIVAASEIAAVLAMRSVSPSVDGRAIDDYLTYLYVPPPRTGIAGVRELPPGHSLRWTARDGATLERYWQPPSRLKGAPPSSRRVRELLDDAVNAHLESDVPVGVFLSGGLDSSSLVALAAPRTAGKLKTFCVTFGDEGRHLDERRFAREVADRYSTDHREIRVQADVAAILPELVTRFGQPFGNPTAVLTYALARAARAYVKVALAGDGGDELLGGYPRYRGLWLADLLRMVPASTMARARRALERLGPSRAARGRFTDRAQRFLARADQPLDTMYFGWVTYLDAARKERLLYDRDGLLLSAPPNEPYEFLADIRRRHADVPSRDATALVDVESFLPCNVLAYGDRMSMAHALEVRVPYCDHRLVEELAPMPISAKMPAGISKGLFRWAMRRDLPPGVLAHRKVGFNPPIAAWLSTGLGPLVGEVLSERSVRAGGILAWSAVGELVTQFRRGDHSVAHSLWSLIVLTAWMDWLGRQRAGPS
ncbi:MAG: asparagine synthase (glutamine-hydrolyzing) [Polyangiaceae bacterium]|jgi:asparagine synthase (glutamine-hydrolysing)